MGEGGLGIHFLLDSLGPSSNISFPGGRGHCSVLGTDLCWESFFLPATVLRLQEV